MATDFAAAGLSLKIGPAETATPPISVKPYSLLSKDGVQLPEPGADEVARSGGKAAVFEDRRPDREEHAGLYCWRERVEWHAVQRTEGVAVIRNLRSVQIRVTVAIDVDAGLDEADELHQVGDSLDHRVGIAAEGSLALRLGAFEVPDLPIAILVEAPAASGQNHVLPSVRLIVKVLAGPKPCPTALIWICAKPRADTTECPNRRRSSCADRARGPRWRPASLPLA